MWLCGLFCVFITEQPETKKVATNDGKCLLLFSCLLITSLISRQMDYDVSPQPSQPWEGWVALQGKLSSNLPGRCVCVFYTLMVLSTILDQHQRNSRFQMEWLDLVSTFFLRVKLQFLFLLCETEIFHSCLVIGRGGEQISRIQQESGCKIQIAPGKSVLFWQWNKKTTIASILGCWN